ncbi:hypothetical protein L7F22_034723 [Adiantum nelumboides]|nr:hypothetical protein [Adiantum nelumboides]
MARVASSSGFITAPALLTCSGRLHFRQCPTRVRQGICLPLAASITADAPQDVKQVQEGDTKGLALLACPICFKPLQSDGQRSFKRFQCKHCNKMYASNGTYLDLTITAGLKDYEEVMQPSTEFFRNPAISFVYERGYRQAFRVFGYPGPDEELKLAKKYLERATGGVLVDLSCASGLFTRRLVKSGLYSSVIGLDFSESMLEQFQGFVQEDVTLSKLDLILIRADVGRLPFATGTIDAVHAGAALHCWPSPSNAVAEVSRILKPGGVFVASTNALDVIEPVKQTLRRAYGATGFWTERELKDLCGSCGLVNWSCIQNSAFIMFSAQKPS